MVLFVGTRILFSVAMLGLIIGVADAQDRWQSAPGQFDYYVMSCRCRGHRHSVRLPRATPVVSNAGHVPFLSLCMVYGRNTNAGFLNPVWCLRQGSNAIL